MNTIDKESLDALVEMGFVRTFFAVESGSEFIRTQIMKKKLSQEQVYHFFDLLSKYPQIQYTVLFIIGFPEETEKTLQETYDLIKKYNFKKVAIGFAVPYPGTMLYMQTIKENLLTVNSEDLYKFPALYNFSSKPIIKPYKIDTERLIEFRIKVYEEFNKKNNQKIRF